MIRAGASPFGSGRAPSPLRRIHLLASRIRRGLLVEAGTSIVEFAMSLTVLFMMVFGVMAICLALYTYNVVAESARAACRYAIVRGSACNSFSDCNVTGAQLQTYIRGLGFPGINPSSLSVNPDCSTITDCWPNGNKNPGNPVKVTVNYQFLLSIPFVPQQTLSMSSTSEMVISQ